MTLSCGRIKAWRGTRTCVFSETTLDHLDIWGAVNQERKVYQGNDRRLVHRTFGLARNYCAKPCLLAGNFPTGRELRGNGSSVQGSKEASWAP
jgi:hypothetical protein